MKAQDCKDLSEIWRREIKKGKNRRKKKENGDMDNERK